MVVRGLGNRLAAAMEVGHGVLRLLPTWVPRSFATPGRRLRLASEDLYVLGTQRGGVDERWFASTIAADNGPGTPADEGLSYIAGQDGIHFPLVQAIAEDPVATIGAEMAAKYGKWPVYAKFFDNDGPLPHHLHHRMEHAKLVGREPKPEAYYFPPQMNQTIGSFPFTFFGLQAGTTRADIRRCLERWSMGDNGILDLSGAYRLQPGTGWLVPPGILHAPGSLCTFEVQWGSDVFAMYQSMVDDRPVAWELLVKDVPEEHHRDLDFIVDLIDWDGNLDTSFKRHHYLKPVPVADTSAEGYQDQWVIYGLIDGQDSFAARELTVRPGSSLVLHDPGASGVVVVQGCGHVAGFDTQVSTSIKYGQATFDEFFFTAAAAADGIPIINNGRDDLVLLRYFGPGVNSTMPSAGGTGQDDL